MEPPPISLIKSKNDEESDKDSVKIKLRRDPASAKSDLYEFKLALFDNGKPEEFLFFISKFQMTLKAAGTLASGVKIRYLSMIVCEEVLHQLNMLSSEVKSTTLEHLKSIILGLRAYFFPVNALPEQQCMIRRGMRKPHSVKVRRYTACIIDINEYLAVLTGSKASNKICET